MLPTRERFAGLQSAVPDDEGDTRVEDLLDGALQRVFSAALMLRRAQLQVEQEEIEDAIDRLENVARDIQFAAFSSDADGTREDELQIIGFTGLPESRLQSHNLPHRGSAVPRRYSQLLETVILLYSTVSSAANHAEESAENDWIEIESALRNVHLALQAVENVGCRRDDHSGTVRTQTTPRTVLRPGGE